MAKFGRTEERKADIKKRLSKGAHSTGQKEILQAGAGLLTALPELIAGDIPGAINTGMKSAEVTGDIATSIEEGDAGKAVGKGLAAATKVVTPAALADGGDPLAALAGGGGAALEATGGGVDVEEWMEATPKKTAARRLLSPEDARPERTSWALAPDAEAMALLEEAEGVGDPSLANVWGKHRKGGQ